jgi:insertion element IS1 protein InsB
LAVFLQSNDQSIDIELDEMWSFVGSKRCKVWIWIAYHRESRQILGWVTGDRSQKTLDKLLIFLSIFPIERFRTDHYPAYINRISSDILELGKRGTQGIERVNLTIRNFVRRLNRKTICYSRRLDMHELAIYLVIKKLFYWKGDFLNKAIVKNADKRFSIWPVGPLPSFLP